MTTKTKSKKWPELGIITKNVIKDKEGKVVTDSKGQPLTRLDFKVADNVTILVDGERVELNQYRSGTMVSPVDEVESLFKRGVIKEEEIETRREKAKETHSWLRYKVTLPPPRTTTQE